MRSTSRTSRADLGTKLRVEVGERLVQAATRRARAPARERAPRAAAARPRASCGIRSSSPPRCTSSSRSFTLVRVAAAETERDVPGDIEVREQRPVLKYHPRHDAVRAASHVVEARHRAPRHLHDARVRSLETCDQAKRRGLSAAARPQQAQKFPAALPRGRSRRRPPCRRSDLTSPVAAHHELRASVPPEFVSADHGARAPSSGIAETSTTIRAGTAARGDTARVPMLTSRSVSRASRTQSGEAAASPGAPSSRSGTPGPYPRPPGRARSGSTHSTHDNGAAPRPSVRPASSTRGFSCSRPDFSGLCRLRQEQHDVGRDHERQRLVHDRCVARREEDERQRDHEPRKRIPDVRHSLRRDRPPALDDARPEPRPAAPTGASPQPRRLRRRTPSCPLRPAVRFSGIPAANPRTRR